MNVRGGWDFVLPFRGRRVAAMVIVGTAMGASTVAFQSVVGNRILTPSILGFDALYQFIQTTLVFALSASALATMAPAWRFGISLAIMLAVSLALFLGLFARQRSAHVVLLVGVVVGILLRSGSALMTRMIAPSELLVLQGFTFASFTGINETLLIVGATIVAAGLATLFAVRRQLDVLALGRDTSTSLGLDHRRWTVAIIGIVAVLVATSTALVGPITFLGLLVAHLAYRASGTSRHAHTLPLAALIAVVTLVGGQLVLEHILNMGTVLSVVIDFLGGVVFIALLIAGGKKS
jgi:iron complex transport system permease protein